MLIIYCAVLCCLQLAAEYKFLSCFNQVLVERYCRVNLAVKIVTSSSERFAVPLIYFSAAEVLSKVCYNFANHSIMASRLIRMTRMLRIFMHMMCNFQGFFVDFPSCAKKIKWQEVGDGDAINGINDQPIYF